MKHYLTEAVDAVEIYRTPEKIVEFVKKETMRELKFRAFAQGEMHYFDLSDTIAPFFENNVNQFTGLKDIHGKDIYEGDIVKWGHRESDGSEHWTRVAVVEINPDIQFRMLYYIVTATCEQKKMDGYVFRYGNFAYKNTEKYLEIIGNIYEKSNRKN